MRTWTAQGHIRHRLLVNAVVDPDEAAALLPPGVHPHVTEAGTVVGCCLLDVDHVRPAGVAARAGIAFRAAAHRISVTWDDGTERHVGVYVPVRLTDSRWVAGAGGRVAPGVHRRTPIRRTDDGDRLTWSVVDASWGIDVTARTTPLRLGDDPVGAVCVGAAVGLSSGRDGTLEGVRMSPGACDVRAVEVDELRSSFLSSYASATPATSYLMRDIDVTWTPEATRPAQVVIR
ncbi:MAG: hypothetical protein JWN29_816 [Acidimicrobiales bacterium]|nr:hypothetical protein [Acidimicrobiales bacterium]